MPQKIKVLIVIVGLFIGVELLLSLMQWVRWKKEIVPYNVTFFLRPLVRVFVDHDLRPRQHASNDSYWNYETDRMKPGRHSPSDGAPEFTINSYGIRGDEFQIPKPDGIYRILVLGSSTALGLLSPDDETYPEILEQILNSQSPTNKIEVINYGMGSKSLYYNARHYFEEADRLQPDLVILNNIRNTWYYDENQQICNYFDIVVPQRRYRTKICHFLTDHILMFRFVRRGYEHFLFKSWLHQTKKYNKKFFETIYHDMLEALYRDTKRRNIPFMIILEPYYYDPPTQLRFKALTKEQLYEEFHRNLGLGKLILPSLLYLEVYRLKEEHPDIILLDPIEAFIIEEEKTLPADIFDGAVHLTSKGNRLLAEMIAQKLLEQVPFN